MPNLLAHLVFYGWPLAVAVLYTRLPRVEATMWAVIGAYVLLPQRMTFDLPLLPAYDRNTASAFAALALCVALDARDRRLGAAPARRWLPESAGLRLLVLALIASPLLTALTNGDVIRLGQTTLPRQTLYDGASGINSALTTLLPLLLARRYLAGAEAQARALRIWALAGLAFAFPVLLEARLAPQLHEWIYGFRPFDFSQQLRNDGFRPVVFMQHGLWAAIFTATGLIAAAAMVRVASGAAKALWLAGTGLLAIALLVSNSFGALALALLIAPFALAAPTRLQTVCAAALALIVLLYPMARSVGVVPASSLVAAAASVSDERGRSLEFRLLNEDILLAKANQRPLFGWGIWGRARVYDDITGRDLSVTDGRWIIVFGEQGWLGYLATYGLLTVPILMLARRRLVETPPATAGFALLLVANLIDTIANGTLTPVTWLAAGSLIGQLEASKSTPAPPARIQVAPAAVRAGASRGAAAFSRRSPLVPSKAEPKS